MKSFSRSSTERALNFPLGEGNTLDVVGSPEMIASIFKTTEGFIVAKVRPRKILDLSTRRFGKDRRLFHDEAFTSDVIDLAAERHGRTIRNKSRLPVGVLKELMSEPEMPQVRPMSMRCPGLISPCRQRLSTRAWQEWSVPADLAGWISR